MVVDNYPPDRLVVLVESHGVDVVRIDREPWHGFIYNGQLYRPLLPGNWNGEHLFRWSDDGTIIGVEYILDEGITLDSHILKEISECPSCEIMHESKPHVHFRVFLGALRCFSNSEELAGRNLAVVGGHCLFAGSEGKKYAFVFDMAGLPRDDKAQLMSRFREVDVQCVEPVPPK